MYLLVFDEFATTIGALPAAGVLKALEIDSKMLEHGWENYRLYLPSDAYSIFCFRQFVRGVKLGKAMPPCMHLPEAHVKFYRQMVIRLIQAHELADSAMQQFDEEFSIAH